MGGKENEVIGEGELAGRGGVNERKEGGRLLALCKP